MLVNSKHGDQNGRWIGQNADISQTDDGATAAMWPRSCTGVIRKDLPGVKVGQGLF